MLYDMKVASDSFVTYTARIERCFRAFWKHVADKEKKTQSTEMFEIIPAILKYYW